MAQSQIYTKLAQVAVKLESLQDTYEAPALGDVMLAEIPETPLALESENFIPAYSRNDLMQMDEVPGPAGAEVSFRVYCNSASRRNIQRWSTRSPRSRCMTIFR